MDRERIIRKMKLCHLRPNGTKRTYKIVRKLGHGGNGVTFIVKGGNKELVAKVYIPPDKRDLDTTASKRFKREIELFSRTRHPFLVPVEGTGKLDIGAYTLPFYLMPVAKGTLRQLIPSTFVLSTLAERLRVFTQIISGVSYLHHVGIFHRDLKPENVLLFANDIPKVADLGIAHVDPRFIDGTKLTIPRDELMDRDYYAPEQKSDDATKVDHRADIYALGLIFYELISGIFPSRPNLPPLSSFDNRLSHLDKIFRKMTAYDCKQRYQSLDVIQDELTWTLISSGIPAEVPSSEEEDKKNLRRLIRSSNTVHQARAFEIAQRLADKALPELHEMTGDRRVAVALTAYKLIGNITHKDSLPYLLEGLYPRRTSQKPRFVTGEAAADALRNYSIDDRLGILKRVKDIVMASHIAKVINGIPTGKTYPLVLNIYQSKLFYEDWSQQSGIAFLLHINQDKAWRIVNQKLSSHETIYSFTIFRDFYPYVNQQRKMLLIDYILNRSGNLSSWEPPRILDALSESQLPTEFILSSISKLKDIAQRCIRKWDDRQTFIRRLEQEEKRIEISASKISKIRGLLT